jgi:holo-[acyl-carrier-protein] synthase
MVKGIGTDILAIEKLRPILDQPNYLSDSFIQKTYTKNEIALAESRSIPIYCYATRFAGKEAVFKAFGIHGNDIRLNEIEILSDENEAPYVLLSKNAEKIAKEKEISQILISLSYEEQYAIAYCIME